MPKVVMSILENFQAMKLIEEHCHKVGDDGALYDAGWNDARLAAEVNPRLGPHHIAHLRQQLVGKLITARANSDDRVDRLVSAFNELCERLGASDLKVK